MIIGRRHLIAGLSGLVFMAPRKAAATSAPPPALSVTIDDFQALDTPLMTAWDRHGAILQVLDTYRMRAAGFPAGKFIDNPLGAMMLRTWSRRQHIIGNHSYTHPYFSGKDPAPTAMMADIQQAELLLTRYPTYRKLFRFPYLEEGNTQAARDRMRGLLYQNGYLNAYVTIDTSDWYINSRLLTRLRLDPGASIEPYRRYYLDHLWDRAVFYDGLARRITGSSIKHTLLLHHNLTTGLFLGDALAMFRSRGWMLADVADAFDQPVFRSLPMIVPAGQSLVWAIAKERGGFEKDLRYPGEDDSYEKPGMDKRGL